MNLDEPLVPFITILGAQQKVEYEGLHLICFSCGKYGNKVEGCPGTSSTIQASHLVSVGLKDAKESCFGLWMLPKHGQRRMKKCGDGR